MLIEELAPRYDAIETHELRIDAPKAIVYAALWRTDFGRSFVTKSLLALRSLPAAVFRSADAPPRPARVDLDAIMNAGFGCLAESEGEEIVLGVTGRFWRPTGNVLPFRRSDFEQTVAPGTARGVWNFHVCEEAGRAVLSTQTRVVCGDAASRRKFLAYWVLVRPFSGLIRRIMLRAVAAECRRMRERQG